VRRSVEPVATLTGGEFQRLAEHRGGRTAAEQRGDHHKHGQRRWGHGGLTNEWRGNIADDWYWRSHGLLPSMHRVAANTLSNLRAMALLP